MDLYKCYAQQTKSVNLEVNAPQDLQPFHHNLHPVSLFHHHLHHQHLHAHPQQGRPTASSTQALSVPGTNTVDSKWHTSFECANQTIFLMC